MCASSATISIKLNNRAIFVVPCGGLSPAVGFAPPGLSLVFYNLPVLWDSKPLMLSTILHELIHKADEMLDIGLSERQTTKLGEVFGALLRENNWLGAIRELVEANSEETGPSDG